jgi:hypothetical protein
MPRYSGSYATPRLDLGVAMLEYLFSTANYIGTQVLPIFSTPKKSAEFSKITRASLLRSRNVKRAPRTAYSRDEFDAKDQAYRCEERGHEQPVDDTERELYASDFDAELQASTLAMNIVQQEQEVDVVAMLTDTANTWKGDYFTDNKANPWSTVGTDIIGQVQDTKEKVRGRIGMDPNALIISKATLVSIKKNTGIKDAIKYTAIPTEQQILDALAGLLGLDKVIVANVVRNTANEGAAETLGDVFPKKYAMVARIAKTNLLQEPCLGRTMLWVQDSPDAVMVEQYREEQTRSDVFRARQHTDEVIWDPAYGQLVQIEVA